MADERRTEGEPHDRLTRLCDAMTRTLEAHPEFNGDKAIVMLDDGDRGGIALFGYDDDKTAIVDLLTHLGALFKVHGMKLDVVGIPNSPEGIDD